MIARAGEVAAQPGHWWCDQLNNHDAIAGYLPLGEEIRTQTGGRVDAFVHVVGTAHSIHGCGHGASGPQARVSRCSRGACGISRLSGGPTGSNRIEGIGIGFIPPLWEPDQVDEIQQVSADEAMAMARRLARDGLFAWHGEREVPIADSAMLRSRYRSRSVRLEFDGPDIAAALGDADVRLGGWVAGLSYDDRLDVDRSQSNVVYVGAASCGPWLDRHWVVPSSSPRLLVHVVDDEIAGALRDRHGRFVPPRAVAVDLAELGGARPIEAALRIWNR